MGAIERDMLSIRQRTCQTCGMLLDDAGEFHPYVFCVLKKAGRDPWADLKWVNAALGVDTRHWPSRAPLIRDHAALTGEAVEATSSAES